MFSMEKRKQRGILQLIADEPDIAEVHSKRTRSNRQCLQEGNSNYILRKTFHHNDGQILEEVVRRGSGIFVLGDSQSSAGRGLEQPAVNWPYSEQYKDWKPPEVPSHLYFSINLDLNKSRGWERAAIKELWSIWRL